MARVALATLMLQNANFLIFDEPTNHLDVETIETLEDAIASYDGTVLLVSHDRALLRDLTTRIWSLKHEKIEDYPGDFAEWEATHAGRRRAEAAKVAAAKAEDRKRSSQSKTDAPTGPRPLTAARRALDQAESEVGTREGRVHELTKALEAPDLYATGEGAKRAAELVRALGAEKEALGRAMVAWEAAQSRVEELENNAV